MTSRDKKPAAKPSSSRPAGGIRTLSDLNRPTAHDSDSDDDDNAPQEYYTGGEKSGMLVQDPNKRNDVDEIFNQARQSGGVEGPMENLRPSSSRSFTGTGRLLSGEPVPAQAAPEQPQNVIHNIVFWRNGFTVNDGPLRRLDDPENAPFLESIRKSECPRELEPADRRSSVHVNLIRRDENCPEPVVAPQVAFQGVGRTLGRNADDAAPEANAAPTSTPSAGLVLDSTLPSTSIQLRLADGTRMVAHFNLHHTVSDIRAFINSSRPDGPRTYQLQTVGFPPQQLTDQNQTIEQAGLANSIMPSRMRTRSAGQPVAESRGRGTGERVGRGGRGREPRGEGVNENVDGANGGVPEFSTIIAQQLQNLLPAMLTQVGNQRNVRNQDGNVVNEKVQENVGNVIVNGNRMCMCLKDHLDAQERKQHTSTLENALDFEDEILDAKVQENEATPLSDEEIALDVASQGTMAFGSGGEWQDFDFDLTNYGIDD
uniref:Plant UBX domain-containing protein 4-like n=1 Tax=Tanacetum cinerariifolium TaxID=118510 RepID=A0A6L2J3W8_TANCI|nr:plant UBX domain-containing protein 4-like [Tanacetum cinerariifolium]